jgi:hypothetical protein
MYYATKGRVLKTSRKKRLGCFWKVWHSCHVGFIYKFLALKVGQHGTFKLQFLFNAPYSMDSICVHKVKHIPISVVQKLYIYRGGQKSVCKRLGLLCAHRWPNDFNFCWYHLISPLIRGIHQKEREMWSFFSNERSFLHFSGIQDASIRFLCSALCLASHDTIFLKKWEL